MDRTKLIELFRNGMQYPPGKHRFWISRCFEITVREDDVVELDEYEGFSSEGGQSAHDGTGRPGAKPKGMFHVGRSVVRLSDGLVEEEPGRGWRARR